MKACYADYNYITNVLNVKKIMAKWGEIDKIVRFSGQNHKLLQINNEKKERSVLVRFMYQNGSFFVRTRAAEMVRNYKIGKDGTFK